MTGTWIGRGSECRRCSGRRGVHDVRAGTPPPLVVRDDQEAEAAILHESKEEEWRKEEEGATAYQARLAEAMALSAIRDCVVPPMAPPSPAKTEPGPTALRTESYTWDGVVREWVNAPPFWLGATPS
ncbi:Pre-mRNA-processing factor 39 [Hordeum vulgare]|nr:Pre-mRNA-processing factor 39 [Hordeum vulgare]